MPSLKQILSSRTNQFALLLAVLSVLQGFVFVLPIAPWQQAVVGVGIAVIVFILRAITNQPLSEK